MFKTIQNLFWLLLAKYQKISIWQDGTTGYENTYSVARPKFPRYLDMNTGDWVPFKGDGLTHTPDKKLAQHAYDHYILKLI